MFSWFRKKAKTSISGSDVVDNYTSNTKIRESYLEEEIQPEVKVIKYPELENKIYFMENNIERSFPEQFEDVDSGEIIYFHKDKYFQTIEEELARSGIGEKIDRIEIVCGLDGSGDCGVKVVDKKLFITIRIQSLILGIGREGYIQDYEEEQNSKFREVFAHELEHAKDGVSIYLKYGYKEYESIRANNVTNLAWQILSEYSACRKISERFHTFDTHVQIKIEGIAMNMDNCFKGQEWGYTPIQLLYLLDYAIATRSAHADVSSGELVYLETDKEDEKAFIAAMRSLFIKYYDIQPLNMAQYEELGNDLITTYLTIVHGVDHNSTEDYMHFFQ
ncbi:hypothetical protein P5G61_22100 [Paenibacillus sp. F6_3S_P_1C]|uniref:Uncharacterized protein n=3 Tax=Paenibacillus TaxID=44249 RepID=A0ABT8JFQ8_9BACL|nr:hypothetical protein [Paenibacillus vandeheii]MDN4603951.1 hypothetical protein [Paenibacillus vandeheii]